MSLVSRYARHYADNEFQKSEMSASVTHTAARIPFQNVPPSPSTSAEGGRAKGHGLVVGTTHKFTGQLQQSKDAPRKNAHTIFKSIILLWYPILLERKHSVNVLQCNRLVLLVLKPLGPLIFVFGSGGWLVTED